MLKHKLCKNCNSLKSVFEFYIRRKAGVTIGYHHPCKLCHSENSKTRWQRHKDVILKRHREIRIENKINAIEYLGNFCKDCGRQYPLVAYDFHHIGAKDKDVGSLLLNSWNKIKEELDKCVLLCSNCHRIRHYGETFK